MQSKRPLPVPLLVSLVSAKNTTHLVPDLVELIAALVDALDRALDLLLELARRGHS